MPVTTAGKFGSMQGNLSGIKDAGDFSLTRVPALYLAVERYREWVTWNKRVYLSFIRTGDVYWMSVQTSARTLQELAPVDFVKVDVEGAG